MERPWLKVYPEGLRWNLEYPEVPAYHSLFQQIEQYPDRAALIFYGKAITYRQLGRLIDRFAVALTKEMGIQKGDRVGIILPNCPQNVIATFGAQRAGAIPVQFNPLYVAREIASQVKDSGCRVMVTLDMFWGKVREAGGIEHYVVTSLWDYMPLPLNLLAPLKLKPPKINDPLAVRWNAFLRQNTGGFVPVPIDPKEDIAVLIYTGGTTGVSKGVMLTHRNILANNLQIKEWLHRPVGENDTVLVALPLFHSYGFTVSLGQALAAGATCVLMPKFEAGEALKLIQKYKPQSMPGVPTIYTALLNHPDLAKYDLKSLEYLISGGAPMPVELLHQFEETTGAVISEGYGLTETAPVTHSNPLKGKRKPGTVGLPFPDTEVRIVDLETGNDLSIGEEGEILIRGPQVMKGYWNRPAETAEILRDGWLHTGDIGRMDEEGYLSIVDRKKDMVIAGGFNIYPREIDEILYEHPAVQEACAVGVPDDYRGETIKAFVVLKPGATATEQEIIQFCRERLAAYKRPTKVQFLPELPKSAVGKILRRVLAQQEKAEHQAAVAAQYAAGQLGAAHPQGSEGKAQPGEATEPAN